MAIESKTISSIPKGKYRATAGFDVVAHGDYSAIRIEAGEDPSAACPCHMASRIEQGLIELTPAAQVPVGTEEAENAEKV